ncbi:MAG: DNA translocase FtsK [Acholeplasmatales bacterium]|nr:DNA translocase FtsK [Acholeplasmatales bacterium]
MFKKKKKDIYLEDDDVFVIYQMSFPREVNKNINVFTPSKVASPMRGSNVPNRIVYHDNKGQRDVDYNYDYVRNEKEKHLSDEDEVKRFGRKYHEFQILNNEEISKIAGFDISKKEDLDNEDPTRVVKDKKKKTIDSNNSFISSAKDLEELSQNNKEENEEFDMSNDEASFKVNVIDSSDEDISYNQPSASMPKPEATSIPSFLIDESKEEEEIVEPSFDFDNSNDTTGFKVPDLEVPEFNYDVKNNAPIDRNISIEEAMRRANEGEYPELMSGEVGSNRPEGYKANLGIKPIDDTPLVSSNSHEGFNNDKSDVKVESVNEIENLVKTQPTQTEPKKFEPKPLPEKKKEEPKPGNNYKGYKVPWKDIFPKSVTGNDTHPAWLEAKVEVINQTLKAFSIDGEVIDYTKGPAFTLYEIMLSAGVNVKKVLQIKDNLAMNLQVKSLRILAPIPGKNTVGVEAPNDKADIVSFGDILSDDFIKDGKPLNCALGKYIDGSPVYENIYNMPHALIAGATQSGKSVCINTILMSLLIKNSPEKLKLIIVDPKTVEFTQYEGIPHLLTPIITDPEVATQSLKWAVEEMDRRYGVLARARVKNLGDYLKKRETDETLPPLPYIVIIIDEFNDLVMQSGAEVQDYIVRLAQKARAAGMHIMLATQRPTTNVVNGTIKANIPCRIAFRVASAMDSVTILDEGGAEELLGRGDMLIQNQNAPVRAQGAYLKDDEIADCCDYLTSNYGPDYFFSIEELKRSMSSQSNSSFGAKEQAQVPDELLYNVARYCIENEACSINSIQNTFSVGFNKAQRIAQLLEERGVVSSKNGTKARDILVNLEELDQMFGVESQGESLD